jgi:uncharacterized membrane protein
VRSFWQLQPIFGSYVLVAALAAALWLLLLVGPSFAALPRPRRRWLAALRASLILVLLLAMLRPARVTIQRRVRTAQLTVLLDVSRSMEVRDVDGDRTRWQQQTDLVEQAAPQLNEMGEKFNVELLAFAGDVQPLAMSPTGVVLPPAPSGDETNIGDSLEAILQRHRGQRLAAVVLISDGAQQALAPKTPPQRAARLLDRRATPLYTVALGNARDQSQSRDVAIENMQDQYTVFAKNEFLLRVGVRVQGYVNQVIPVALEVTDQIGNVQTVEVREVRATQDNQVAMVEFAYRPEEPGEYQLRVSARQREMNEDNNQMTAFLQVREGGLRALLLTSALLSQEPRCLRWSLDDSPDIELDFQHIDVLRQDEWPLDLTSDVALDQYDVFLIGDLDATALRVDNWQRIADLVEAGRGLLMYGGAHSFGPGGYGDSPLSDVLPVAMSRLDRQPLDPQAPLREDMHLAGPLVMLPTTNSSITHLAPDELNTRTWRELPPLKGANRLGAVKDRAVVLAETESGQPLLVQSGFVAGRVLALATDSTHQWWRYGQEAAHKRFWRQAILWLARRDQQPRGDVWISLPQRRFRTNSRVEFQTGLIDDVGDPVPGANLRATWQRLPDGSPTPVSLFDAGAEQRGAITETQQPGVYRVEVRALEGERELAAHFADFVVLQQDFELNEPAANPGLLDQLAKITARVGGKAIAPEQLSNLLEKIKASPPQDEIETQSKRQLADTGLGAWSLYLLMVALLVVEWILRKRWNLV